MSRKLEFTPEIYYKSMASLRYDKCITAKAFENLGYMSAEESRKIQDSLRIDNGKFVSFEDFMILSKAVDSIFSQEVVYDNSKFSKFEFERDRLIKEKRISNLSDLDKNFFAKMPAEVHVANGIDNETASNNLELSKSDVVDDNGKEVLKRILDEAGTERKERRKPLIILVVMGLVVMILLVLAIALY